MTEIRKIWSEGEIGGEKAYWMGRWNFVMVDLVKNIVETERPEKYWKDFKDRLKSGPGGSGDWKFRLSEKIGKTKIENKDGKARPTDVANLETTLQIIMLLSNKTTISVKSHNNAGNCRYFVIKEAQIPGPLVRNYP